MNSRHVLPALLVLGIAATAAARPVVDQQAPYGKATIEIGGDRPWAVLQTVTAGVRGELMRIELGVGCTGGELTLQIHSLAPGGRLPGTLRSAITIDAASIPEPAAIRTFELDRWPSMAPGDRFSIVLRNRTGTCRLLKGPEARDGSSYPDGDGFFTRDADPIPSSWLQFLDFGVEGDIGFKTIVNVPVSSPPCVVNGFAQPFEAWLPVCRCISDEGLRESRCALLHPSYFLFRTLPTDIRAGEKFKVKWTLVLYTPLDRIVELTDKLTSEFGGVPKAPLTFFAQQVPVGESITLEYEAVAPLKPGKYRVESNVDDGNLQTVIEVLPR